MCHNGEMLKNNYSPIEKTELQFNDEYNSCLIDENNIYKLRPMTLEGCVVRISDVIGYIGKDIEDARRMHLINLDMIPSEVKEVLGTTNSEIMNSLILDIIDNSYGKSYITMSDKVFNALNILKDFNMENIYLKANDKKRIEDYKNMFYSLYDVYLKALNNSKKLNNIYEVYLKDMSKEYIQNNKKEQIIIDYLSGMTDRFLESEFDRYVK